MGFGEALFYLRCGHRVRRRGWNGAGMWVHLQCPDFGSKMDLPYLYLRTAQGNFVPWIASQTDLLSCDWELVGE